MTRVLPDVGRGPDRDEIFTIFFTAHRRGVERFISWRIGSDLAEVDDVCAEVFLVALRRFDQISELSSSAARGWLLRVAHNKCLNVHRSRFRRSRAYHRVAVSPDRDLFDPFDEVYEQLSGTDDIADHAREVLDSLSDTYRIVLELELNGPITGSQMAAALGTTEVAGRLRLMRAKRAFGSEYARRYGWAELPATGGSGS